MFKFQWLSHPEKCSICLRHLTHRRLSRRWTAVDGSGTAPRNHWLIQPPNTSLKIESQARSQRKFFYSLWFDLAGDPTHKLAALKQHSTLDHWHHSQPLGLHIRSQNWMEEKLCQQKCRIKNRRGMKSLWYCSYKKTGHKSVYEKSNSLSKRKTSCQQVSDVSVKTQLQAWMKPLNNRTLEDKHFKTDRN